jgi:CHAT domain-containing protein
MKMLSIILRLVLLIACSNLSLPVFAQNFPPPESVITCLAARQLAAQVDGKLENIKVALYEEHAVKTCTQDLGADHPDTLRSMHNLANTYSDLGQHDKALALIPAWQLGVEKLRNSNISHEQKQSLFAGYSEQYQHWAAQYAKNNRKTEGFDLGDLSKARTLTDSLKAQSALRSLPEAQQSSLQALQTRAQVQQKTMEQLLNTGNSSAERLQTQQQSIDDLKAEYATLHTQLKTKYPKYAALTDLKPATASQAPQLLGTQEVFISYLVRKTGRAQVFVLPPSGQVQWVDLKTIPNHAQTVAAYRELIAPSSKASEQGQMVALKEGGYQWVNAGAALPSNAQGSTPAAANPAPALALLKKYWHDALIKPILPLAGPYARWIISPDKDLALLPFDTLPYTDPTTAQTQATPEQSLAQTKQTTLVQSFAVYALLKAREAEYARLKRPKELFAMGDAVYNDQWQETNSTETVADNRVRPVRTRKAEVVHSTPTGITSDRSELPFSFAAEQYSLSQLWWSNLPGTAREVQTVAHAFEGSGLAQAKVLNPTQSDIFMGAQASEMTLLKLNRENKLKDYRYLLFSAHGYLAQNPSLSALVLSQKGNPDGVDGYITAAEWPQYDLRSDLTVLSACDTGVGNTQSGEGVMGLPCALFIAGNKNTLLTLWPVDDAATAEFMSQFFIKLNAGISQPQALSETKQAFIQHPKWSSPRFWAAFVLYGV